MATPEGRSVSESSPPIRGPLDGPARTEARLVNEPAVRPSEGALLGGDVGRFAQLLAVGFAWSAPLLPAVFAGFGLGAYSHPQVARLYAGHGWPLLAAMLVLACLGIGIVAALMRRPARVRFLWLLIPVAVVLVAVIPFVAPGRSYPVYLVLSLAAIVVPLLGVALCAAVTTVTFWRRSRLLGVAWHHGRDQRRRHDLVGAGPRP